MRTADDNIEYNKMVSRIDHLQKENQKLKEHMVFLKKNGFTYDQLSSKMCLCDRCGIQLTGEFRPKIEEEVMNINEKDKRIDYGTVFFALFIIVFFGAAIYSLVEKVMG